MVEAPFLWEQAGLFYLFYSANTCAAQAATSKKCHVCQQEAPRLAKRAETSARTG